MDNLKKVTDLTNQLARSKRCICPFCTPKLYRFGTICFVLGFSQVYLPWTSWQVRVGVLLAACLPYVVLRCINSRQEIRMMRITRFLLKECRQVYPDYHFTSLWKHLLRRVRSKPHPGGNMYSDSIQVVTMEIRLAQVEAQNRERRERTEQKFASKLQVIREHVRAHPEWTLEHDLLQKVEKFMNAPLQRERYFNQLVHAVQKQLIQAQQPALQVPVALEKKRAHQREREQNLRQVLECILTEPSIPKQSSTAADAKSKPPIVHPQPSAQRAHSAKEIQQQFVHQLRLPTEVDSEHAGAIILWGLLNATSRESYFLNKYRTAERVRRDAARKVSQFQPEKYDSALHWLVTNGVVLIPKSKSHQVTYSLNPHAGKATSSGRPVVELVLQYSKLIAK